MERRIPILFAVLLLTACSTIPRSRDPLPPGEGGYLDMCRGVERAKGPRKIVANALVDGVEVKREASHYAIRADSARVLHCAMYNRGEIIGDGRFGASVTSRVRWSYAYVYTDVGCGAGPVKVELDIRYLFPRWVDEDAAKPGLRARWQAFLSALDAHERGHECVALAAATELKRRFETLEPRSTCRELEAVADAIGDELDARRNRRGAMYDEVTDHGALEGAFLP